MKIRNSLWAAVALSLVPAVGCAVELKVLEWEGYISLYEKEFEAWAKSKGKDIDLVLVAKPDGSPFYIGSADDIFEQVRKKAADVVTPTHNYYKQERGKLMQLLLPLDTSKLGNYASIYPSLRNATFSKNDKGEVHALPLLGGSYALAYDSAKVKAPDSWHVLLRPEAKGKFTVTGDQFEANVYQMAMLAGVKPADVYDYDKMTPEQRQQTAEYLKTLVANADSFWGGLPSVEQLAKLEYATDYWFGVAAANAAGQKWKFASPKEGVTVWLDNVSIAGHVGSDPAKLEAAYMLLDYTVSEEAQAAIAKAFGSVIVNPKAKAKLSPDQASAQPGEDFFVEERFWQPLSDRSRNGFKKMWDDALAAAGKK
ncbi:ABC transporter substrate-binding protein [Pseudomarimonas arenosa]|uniref:Extracellular solute-binding protein n=1 Tax=Pseudomarimonas arenosa TaxID=2774145 RepID=A0AAW3ZNK2_9GAMM|nr:extracellular solute-binding protein [Pseudomarimonas arenosa]MBD8527548.1 extracellular solute-binding protein [Pseudomarimonas arenosa]